MSADTWMECPICKNGGTVRIDYIWDMELTEDGKIIHTAKGECIKCKKEFK